MATGSSERTFVVTALVSVFLLLVFLALLTAVGIMWLLVSGSGKDGGGRSLVEEGPGRSEQVAFASNREGSPQLYVMDVSTGAWKRITAGSGAPTSPVHAPDGERLAYSDGGDIYAIEASGHGEPEQIVSTPSLDYIPAWSPTEKRSPTPAKTTAGPTSASWTRTVRASRRR